ncbi:hypothetical protein BYT27DRAFT_7128485 [Phlegmacium glaucopus]|nr:hypothetical protein BYT27DRAFT_7128485 [Phlegmacium glaucopus]
MSNVTMELGGSPVLNSLDPLVFLTPEHAMQVKIVRYVCAGTAGTFIWDVLLNMNSNYQILQRHRIRLPIIVCFVSTVSSLTYVIGNTVFETASVPSCSVLKKVLAVVTCVAIPSTSLLFFFRTRAVFDRDPWIVGFFAFMWLAVFASCLTPIPGIKVANIGTTNYCMNVQIKTYAPAAAIVPLINDTLVFVSITWRLWCNSSARRTVKDGARVMIFGDYLPAFSKAMLQDGQAYYLSTVTFNLITVAFLYISSIPPILRTPATVPNIALMNIMACRVFRHTILGLYRDNDISTSLISREIRAVHPGDDIKQGQNTAPATAGVTAEGTHECVADDKGPINISTMV